MKNPVILLVIACVLGGCASLKSLGVNFGEYSLKRAIELSSSNFEKDKIDNFSMVSTALRYVEWAAEKNNGFVVAGASNGSEFKELKSCQLDFAALYDSIKATSYALTWRTPKTVLWGKLTYSNLFWIGDCTDSKANGDGVLGWVYVNQWSGLMEEGLVTIPVKVINGNVANGMIIGNKIYQEGPANRSRPIKREKNIKIASIENWSVKDIARSSILSSTDSYNKAGEAMFAAIMAPVVKHGLEVLASANDGNSTYVTVEMVCGLSSCPVKRLILKRNDSTLLDQRTGSGYIASQSGTHHYSATFDTNYGSCSGSFRLSGKEKEYHVRVYKGCRDAGSYSR